MTYAGLRVLILEADKQQSSVYVQLFKSLEVDIIVIDNINDIQLTIDSFSPTIMLINLDLVSLNILEISSVFDPGNCIIYSDQFTHDLISRCNEAGFFMVLELPVTQLKLIKCLDILWKFNQTKSNLMDVLDDKYRVLQRQDAILTSMNAGTYIKDNQLRYISVNNVFLEMIGLSRDQVIGKTDNDIILDSYKCEKFTMQDNHILTSKEPLCDIVEFTNSNDNLKWTSTFKTPYLNANGDVEEILGIIMNITNLVEIKQLFDVVFNSILDGIIIIDDSFKITNYNNMAKTWHCDGSTQTLLGRSCSELFKCDSQVCDNCLAKRTFNNKTVEQREVIISGRWYDIRYYPIIQNDKTTHVIITQRDIHGIKIREQKLEYRLKLEKLLVNISSSFAALDSRNIDKGVNIALTDIVSLFDLSIACVFKLDSTKEHLIKTHHKHRDNIITNLDVGDSVGVEKLGSNFLKLLKSGPFASTEKEFPQTLSCLMADSKLHSSLIIPITAFGNNEDIIGFICVDNSHQFTWSDDIVAVFQMIGEIFATAFTRKLLEEELQHQRQIKEKAITKDVDVWKQESQIKFDKTRSSINIFSNVLNDVLIREQRGTA